MRVSEEVQRSGWHVFWPAVALTAPSRGTGCKLLRWTKDWNIRLFWLSHPLQQRWRASRNLKTNKQTKKRLKLKLNKEKWLGSLYQWRNMLLVMLRSLSSGHVCAIRRNIASAVTADSLAIPHYTMVREPRKGKSRHPTHRVHSHYTLIFLSTQGKHLIRS